MIERIREDLKTQDNRMTADPLFVVIEDLPGDDNFVTACFTQKGAEDYLRANGHNLHNPYIYVTSLYRNTEMIAVRNMLMGDDK